MPDEMIVEDGGRQRAVKVNYPANSKKSRGQEQQPLLEKPPTEKVVTGVVRERKKPAFSRFFGNIVAEDGGSVGSYILMDVMLPAAKNMISDAISQGIDRLLFGDSRPRRSDVRPGYTSYNRVAKPAGYTASAPLSRQSRANHDFSDIIVETRVEAEEVIDHLIEMIKMYGTAKVSDLYDLVGLTGTFTDDRWGWTDLREARVRPTRGGYLLDLPRTESLDS